MARNDHQPQEALPERPCRSAAERRVICGNVVAVVLPPCAGEPDASAAGAIQAARNAQAGAVVALCAEDLAEGESLTRAAAGFELFGLSYGLLEIARGKAEAVMPAYEAVLFLDPAMAAITADHIYELCLDWRQRSGAEAVTSWIQWLRRPPYLVARRFLEGLGASSLTQPTDQGDRPIPQIRVWDHVFGEEKLAAPAAVPSAVSDFFREGTMAALQAVNLAKWADAHPGEQPVSPNQPLSLLGPVKPQPLSSPDATLLEIAREVRGRVREREGVRWADEFGRRCKRDFPLLNDRAHAGKLVYLDSAATAQRLGAALRAQSDFDLHENANVYRGAYELSAQATFTLNDARKRLEDFIGAARRSTVLCANTTAACNLVAQAWGVHHIGEGDVIVTTVAEHHSNMLPFALLAERVGAQMEYVPLAPDGRIDQAAYRAALARKPKLVCVAHVGNVLGIEAPVRDMAAAAHGAGARFLVDAAQSFPHRKIDVAELGADWIAFSGHKAYGPLGIGGLWVAPDAFAEMDPIASGGGAVSHVSTESYYLRPKALQYELGTPPISQAIGLAAAIDYLDALGMDNVARHAAELTRYAVDGLHAIEGVTVLGDHAQADGRAGLVSFTVRGVEPSALAAFLGKLDVCIRAGGHCALPLHASLGLVGSGRISVGVYTTRDDIDAALTAIEACRRVYGQR